MMEQLDVFSSGRDGRRQAIELIGHPGRLHLTQLDHLVAGPK